ncbi:hypothetical protein CAJAP_05136 [Camponotus japonicus]
MSFFIKIKTQEGKDELLPIDPTKMKIIQGSTVIPNYKTTSSTTDLERSEKPQCNVSVLSSLFPQSFPCTETSTLPILLKSKPTSTTLQCFDNREATIDLTTSKQTVATIDLNTTCEQTLASASSSFLHLNSADNMEKPVKKIKTETALLSAEGSKENWTEAEIQLLL